MNLFIGLSLFLSATGAVQPFAMAANLVSCTPPIEKVDKYPLIDAMLSGRSRRFFKGAYMPGPPLQMASKYKPERLTLEEEALMAFAGAGITGYVAADLPFVKAGPANQHTGNGNVMVGLVGRTFASGDAAQLVTLLVINDDGVWLVRRPQDLTRDEIEKVIILGRAKRWVDAYKILRVKILDKRVEVPRHPALTASFNMQSVNKPGTTYFLPIIDYSSIYMTVLFHILSPEIGGFIVDDREAFAPAGVAAYIKSDPELGIENPGGWMNANPKTGLIVTIGGLELMTAQFASVELGGMLQNMRLMAQALGLGGFPNFAGMPGIWGGLLDFDQTRITQIPFPLDLSITRNGKTYMKAYTPENFGGSGYAVAKAFADFKFGPTGTLKNKSGQSAWKDDQRVKAAIPEYSPMLIKAMGDHIDYVQSKYGRVPTSPGPLGYLTAFQAHVLDKDFYDTYYIDGILTDTHQCRSR